MKKIIALILVIVFIPSLLIACGSKQLNIKEANYIVLKDEEDNSSIEITDPKTVEKIIKDINSLSLKKGESIQVPVDWKYQLICYDNDNKIIGVMGIVDAKTIGYDDHYYSIIDGNIDIINGNIDIKIQSSLEGENIIQFVENRGDEYTYDFKLDDDVKNIEASTYDVQYFFTPEEYEIHNYEHVYAITIKFSEN